MAQFTVRIEGLDRLAAVLHALGPSFERRVYPQALNAMARVVRRLAKTKDFGFIDGRGVRPFDRRLGRTKSRRLRATIRNRLITAYYGGRRYRAGRAAVFAGGPGARHAHLVERGHGGPRPARPHPFIGRALIETQGRQFQAFVQKVNERFPRAVAAAAARGNQLGASFGRTVARRARRRVR